MADVRMSVKGLFALAAMYQEEADYWSSKFGRESEGRTVLQQNAAASAARCREKAYNLLGVVTIEPTQIPLLPLEVGVKK